MSVIDKQVGTKKSIREEIVPEGYKRTEVGVIPEDWEVCDLNEDINLLSGHHVLAKYYNTDGKGIPYLTGPADFPDGKIEQTKFTVRPTTICKRGDILVTVKGSGVGTIIESDGEYCISRQLMAIRTKKWFSKFLYYSLLQNGTKIKAAVSGLIPGISRSDLLEQKIPIPKSVYEQRAIAKALSYVDGLIAALDKLIAKKKAIKQAAMQQLLTGKVRLPGFSGEWEVKRLGEIGDCLRGVSYNGQQDLVEGDTEGSIRLLRANNISEGTINLKDLQYVKAHAVFETQILKNNDIIICMANGSKELVGKAALFKSIDSFPYTFGAFMGCFRIKSDKANPNFIFGLFNSQRYRRYLKVLLSGSSINNLKPSDIESMEFKIPSDRIEQDSIASVLSDMEFEIQALERRREKVKQIKQGMMQQLLTGRVRLIKQKKYTNKVAKRTASKKPHSDAFNEAIIISVLAKHFSSEKRVMGRKRYTKLSYLLHRYTDNKIEDYLKKAAGPYNPKTKYKGAEKIALEKGYVRKLTDDDYSGFIAGENIEQAEKYFEKWYGHECIDWLKQFKYKKTEELELITTVDMAIIELQNAGKKVDLESVKKVIRSYPEWKRKLERPIFSDKNILNAIALIQTLFSERKK